MAKSLAGAAELDEIGRRIGSVSPDSRRQWGRMSAAGMLCHLYDSYQVALGERVAGSLRLPLPGGAVKYLALYTPLPWAKGVKTMPEVDQEKGGTPPGSFADDQRRLLDTLEHFSLCRTLEQTRHPFFGSMTNDDWLRWGYLHADHHLRQFSV